MKKPTPEASSEVTLAPGRTRRQFGRDLAVGSAAAVISRPLAALVQESPSDHVRVAVMGVRSRGRGMAREFAMQKNTEVTVLCDVDERYFGPCLETLAKVQDKIPVAEADIRKVVERSDVDVLVIASPDHWHAPAAILAADAGKDSYLEKPCSHNPHEGELLIQAAARTGRVIHMGNQRRSWPGVTRAMTALHEGIIGRVYLARTWYANDRAPIGKGKKVAVPPELNWDLFQGPAPRTDYRDNVHPYNWHWFTRWGTGEALNNGTHELDVARWGMQLGNPERVVATGGRWHAEDDWQFPDTMMLSIEFPEGAAIHWEGRSCNNHLVHGWSRGILFHGETGSMLQVGDAFEVRANDKERTVVMSHGSVIPGQVDAVNLASPDASLDGVHVQNFLEAVRGKEKSNIPIEEAHKTVQLGHLGNIAWSVGRTLEINPSTGRIEGDDEANAFWSREYEPGWEPASS